MACIAKRRDRYIIDFYDNQGNRKRKTLKKGTTKTRAREILRDIDNLACNAANGKLRRKLSLISGHGKEVETSVSIVPMLGLDGEYDGALFLIEDITEHELLEKERQKSVKLESVGTLAGGIAHDFNNILAAIQGNTELLKLQFPDAHPSQKKINNILSASERAKELVMQILAFSRVDQQVCRQACSIFAQS